MSWLLWMVASVSFSCVVPVRFLSYKYDTTKYPNYKCTADADPRNAFDIEKLLSARLKPRPNKVHDVYEVDDSRVRSLKKH